MGKRRKVQPGWWERGYLSHHFWNKKGKIGSILLCAGPSGERLYKWTCIATNGSGHTTDLAQAKCALEQAYAMGWVQVDLDGVQTIESALQDGVVGDSPSDRVGQSSFINVPAGAMRRSSQEDLRIQADLPVWLQSDLFSGLQPAA